MAKKPEKTISIEQVKINTLRAHLLGTTPMIMHRFAAKAWRELLMPSPKKNAAEKAENLKHDPMTEFRQCIYMNRDDGEPSAIHIPAPAVKQAISAAALDLPGATKSQILRLVSIASTQINLFGVPVLGMDMVRSSDMARTPDVRTRPYFPQWACEVEISFVSSLIGEQQIINLLGAAGELAGIGDYRPQKGGAFGKFRVVSSDDKEYRDVVRLQARKAQLAAIAHPAFYDDNAAELFGWFISEVERREKTVPSLPHTAKRKGKAAPAAAAKRKGNGDARQHLS